MDWTTGTIKEVGRGQHRAKGLSGPFCAFWDGWRDCHRTMTGLSAPQVRSPDGHRGGRYAHGASAGFSSAGAMVSRRGGRCRWPWARCPRHGSGHSRAVTCSTDSLGSWHRWCPCARVMGGCVVQSGPPGRLDPRRLYCRRDGPGGRVDFRVRAPNCNRVVGCDSAGSERSESDTALPAEPQRDGAPAALRRAHNGFSGPTFRAIQGVRDLDTGRSPGLLHCCQPERARGSRLHESAFDIVPRRMCAAPGWCLVDVRAIHKCKR
jgi:hypothetical protein